jgi:hypothetical protein
LLREAFVTPGWVTDDVFLTGYGAAQAVPGPLFTFAAYLGFVVTPTPHGIAGATLGLFGIFLPGMLVLLGALPFWDGFRKREDAQAVMRGVNAAGASRRGALQSAMDDIGENAGRFRYRACRLCSAHSLARPSADCCYRLCAGSSWPGVG